MNNNQKCLLKAIKEEILFETTLDIKQEPNESEVEEDEFITITNQQLFSAINEKEEKYYFEIKQEPGTYVVQTDIVVKQEELSTDEDSKFPLLPDITYAIKKETNNTNKNNFKMIENFEEKKSFKRDICKKNYKFRAHLSNRHTKDHLDIKCKLCMKTFPDKRKLSNHVKTHSKIKPFECDICAKRFARKSYLVIHLRIHSDKKLYECNICKMRFRWYTSLDNHRKKNYMKDKLYECDMCKKKYFQKTHLAAHIRTHFGERPFRCNICKLTFSVESSLTYHTKSVHINLKPYKCNVCDMTFDHKSHCLSHIQIHTGKRPYQCKICEKNFIRNTHLIRHLKSHSNAKPYRCNYCSQRSAYKSVISRHEKTAHGNVFK